MDIKKKRDKRRRMSEEENKINREPFDIFQRYLEKYGDEESNNEDNNIISIPLNDFVAWYDCIDDESKKILNMIKPDYTNYQLNHNFVIFPYLFSVQWTNFLYQFYGEIISVKKCKIENTYNLSYHMYIHNRKEHEYAMISFDKEKNENWKKIEIIQKEILKQIELMEASQTRA